MVLIGESRLQAYVTPGGLAQVIATLLDNALMHGKGTVTIRRTQSASSVVIEVEDEGERGARRAGLPDLRAERQRPAGGHRARPRARPDDGRPRTAAGSCSPGAGRRCSRCSCRATRPPATRRRAGAVPPSRPSAWSDERPDGAASGLAVAAAAGARAAGPAARPGGPRAGAGADGAGRARRRRGGEPALRRGPRRSERRGGVGCLGAPGRARPPGPRRRAAPGSHGDSCAGRRGAERWAAAWRRRTPGRAPTAGSRGTLRHRAAGVASARSPGARKTHLRYA